MRPLRSTHIAGSPRSPLVYDRWGEFGRPVLLLHGLLHDRTTWWPLAADLIAVASCTIIAPDLPGHGQSPARADCPAERLARDLDRLVYGLNLLRAPIVVGYGAAAALAMAFADAYPTRCVLTFEEGDEQSVPEELRVYATPSAEPAALTAYASWKVLQSAGGKPGGPGSLLHLTDPRGFAAEIRTFL